MYRVWNFVADYSLLLIFGAVIALIWANVDAHSYHAFTGFVIWDYAPIGHLHDGHRTLTLHYLVNDVLMALFFAIAAKEVWEAVILRNGSLRGKKAATPLFATAGGMFWPDRRLSGPGGGAGIGHLQCRRQWMGHSNRY